jgi:hypothetical protein
MDLPPAWASPIKVLAGVGARAFSSEVGSGSRKENASNQKKLEPPFRFNRNGKGASRHRRGCQFALSRDGPSRVRGRGERHNENNKQRFVAARLMVTPMLFGLKSRVGNFSANWPMTCLLVLSVTAMAGTALAQTTGSGESTSKPPPDKDGVPPGGCMPIGLTASGEIVFPFACRALIERQRGTIDLQKPAARDEKPVSAEKQAR